MRKRRWKTKAFSVITAASMVMAMCPATAYAVTGDQVAADGTYTGGATVVSDDPYDADTNEWGWSDYDVTVELTVEDGVFTDVSVTCGKTYTNDSDRYFDRALTKFESALKEKDATENTVELFDIDTVTNATRTAKALKDAALSAIQDAEPAEESGTGEEGSEEGGSGGEGSGESGSGDESSEGEVSEDAVYVLMNIPYAQFYAAELNNDVEVDAYTSATLAKSRTGTLVNGSYHVDPEGTDITGVTFPVLLGEGVTLDDLAEYTQITDDDSVTITVTNRGNETSTTYEGSDALFESDSYSYYVLDEGDAPSYYKILTVNEDGGFSFSAIAGDTAATTLGDEITPVFTTDTTYGDYQLDLEGLTDYIDSNDTAIYGVIISTEEGHDYGLRHMENIWLAYELAWCTGFTESVHNCPTSSAHYESMMGETITCVTYYTEDGIYEIPLDGIYVPVKFDCTLTVEDAAVSSGETTVEIEGLPDDFDAVYSVDGLDDVSVADGVLTYDAAAAEKGSYTLTVSDAGGKYVDVTADFTLYTEDMPVKYNEDSTNPALVAADGFSDADFEDYISNITSVNINGTDYPATGRGAVTVINEDGTLDTSATPFADAAEDSEFEITVTATGYLPYTFTYVAAADENEPSDGGEGSGSEGSGSEGTGNEGSDSEGSDSEGTGSEDSGSEGSDSKGTGSEESGSEGSDSEGSGSGSGSGNSTSSGDSTGSDSSTVQTGDTTPIALFMLLVVVSGAAAGILVVAGRKRR